MKNNIPAELLELKTRFDQWRATRKTKVEPIPDALRSAALEMSKQFSSTLLQRVLKIQLWHLKRRGPTNHPPRAGKSNLPRPAFFKLPLETVLPETAATSPGNHGYRIQIERPDGARLTLFLPTADASSIRQLCADFLGGQGQ